MLTCESAFSHLKGKRAESLLASFNLDDWWVEGGMGLDFLRSETLLETCWLFDIADGWMTSLRAEVALYVDIF